MKTRIKFAFLVLFLAFTAFTAQATDVALLYPFPVQENFFSKVLRCKWHISCYRQKFGATITTILATDLISASRATINTNFTNLNSGKVEVSDLGASTTMPQLTTLVNVTQLGVISSSTWRGSLIGIPFGGTGSSTLSSNRILLGNGVSPITVVNGFGTSGQFLTSNGVNTAPTWTTSSVSLTAFYAWTGLHTFNGLSVGIGTTTASTTLSVQGDALISGTSTVGNLVATSTLKVSGNSSFTQGVTIGGTGTTTTGANLRIANNLIVDGSASTTNMTVSGTCFNCATNGYERNTGTCTLDGASPSSCAVTVNCSSGKNAVGGGFDGFSGQPAGDVFKWDSFPSNNTSWNLEVRGPNGNTSAFTGYVVCVKN